jgi:carboxylate-amine ligase
MSVPVTAQTDVGAIFDAPAPLTVGVEEEVMLLDPSTLDLAPRGREALSLLDGDPRFKLELPASQLEIVLPPLSSAAEVRAELLQARRDLAAALGSSFALAGSGVHAFSAPLGELNEGPRYEAILAEYGDVARAQLVFALQVHVCVRGAARALAVYNALRGRLPLVAALAANGPLYAGRDSGLASVRPEISGLLPRQGVAPSFGSWNEFEAALARLRDPAQWWWELRPHRTHGTLEVRVPDTQATVAESCAVVAVVHALALWLCECFDAGEELPVRPRWEIEEDRWLACRHGVAGPLEDRVGALLDDLEPVAARQGAAAEFAVARSMAASGGGAQRQRAVFASEGDRAAVEDLAARFTTD